MARFLFVTWPGGGNQPPAIGLAQTLRERGYEVAFAGYAMQRSRFAGQGFPFTVLERSSAAFRPEGGMPALIAGVFACPEHLQDVADSVVRAQYDALVVDCMMFGALAAAEQLGLPTAVLAHSAPSLLVIPPLGEPNADRLVRPLNAVRAAAGRAPVVALWDAWAHFPTLCATIPELDPRAAEVPPSFAFVGPIFERAPASGWRAPWPLDDPRPLAVVSFSTSGHWNQTSRIGRTLEALSGSPYRVLVTTGMADVAGLPVPQNTALAPHVPHGEILAGAAVTVTHAGHGTVIASLMHGVPLVCLPNPAADQPWLAARVAALGAGLALDGESATAAEIASAVHQVLANRSYAASARHLAQAIAVAPGAEAAVSRLERLAVYVR